MHTTHSWTSNTATIHVEGLSSSVRMLHITDAHVSCIDERDEEHVEACASHRRTDADLPSTLEFVRSLVAAENLIGVFCGHIHFDHADTLSRSAVQYVGAPGFDAQKRLVEFLPL